jgi:hypothetical protein
MHGNFVWVWKFTKSKDYHMQGLSTIVGDSVRKSKSGEILPPAKKHLISDYNNPGKWVICELVEVNE